MTADPDGPGPAPADESSHDAVPRPGPGRGQRGALWVGALGGAIAWFMLGDLPVAARIWTAILLAPLPAAVSAQHRLVTDPVSLPRVPVYMSSIISLWAMALITTLVTRASGFVAADLGIASIGILPGVAWAAGATAAGMAIVFAAHAMNIGTTALLEAVIPRTAHEKSVFAGLSITAGVCEELVFRGFLILTIATASGSIALAALLSTVVFGWMHTYQSIKGAAGAGLLGAILVVPVLVTGSILPSIAAHAAIDILAGIIFAPALYGRLA